MKSILLGIALGVILWQLITFAVFLLSSGDEETTLSVGMAICFLGVFVADEIVQKAWILISKRYNIYDIYTASNQEDLVWKSYFMTAKTAQKFHQLGIGEDPHPFCIRFVKSRKKVNSVPDRRYIITDRKLRERNIIGLSEDDLQKLLVKEDSLGN